MSQHVTFLKSLSREPDPERLQHKFLQLLLGLQNVERGSIWVRREGGYECIEAAGVGSEAVLGLRLPPEQKSVVGWVIENGELTIAEAGQDPRHNAEAEAGIDLKSRLILCLPMLLSDGAVYGAVQIIDTSAGGRRLNLKKDYLALLQDLVDIGSIALSHSLAVSRETAQAGRLRQAMEEIYSGRVPLLGSSARFHKVMDKVQHYAATDYPVLIYGESGTGKELVAREIHNRSPRKARPMLVQNCSAIPPGLLESELFGHEKGAFTGADQSKVGLFEAATGGTVFLDEIGEMSADLQAKLLRVLQEQEVKPVGSARTRRVDVRIISATNRDLEEAIGAKAFRQDLFYRLNVLPLTLPPLRDRKEDIPLLVEHFLKREARLLGCAAKAVSAEAMEHLLRYHWPGNIRELENFIKQLMALVESPQVGVSDVPGYIRRDQYCREAPFDDEDDGDLPDGPCGPLLNLEGLTWAEVERAYARYLLAAHDGSPVRAARAANLNRSTFASRLRKLGIK